MQPEIERGPESGYICVWGSTMREKVVDPEGVVAVCPGCGEEAQLIGKSAQAYCSVFYIPLVPEGKGEDFFECTRCGGKFQGSIAEIRGEIAERTEVAEGEVIEKRRALNLDPDDEDAANDLAMALMQLDRVAEARRVAEEFVARRPESANAQLLLGRILLHQDHAVQALEVFNRAATLSPQHAGVHFYRAVALYNEPIQRTADALEAAREAHRCGHPQAREFIEALEQETGGQG